MLRVTILLATLTAVLLPAWPKGKERAWEKGTVVAVFSPKDQKAGEQTPLDPYIMSPDQSPYPRASIATAPKWAFVVEVGGARVVATSDSVGRGSYLAKLAQGDTVKAAVEGRTLYILEPGSKQKQHRLSIRERTVPPAPKK